MRSTGGGVSARCTTVRCMEPLTVVLHSCCTRAGVARGHALHEGVRCTSIVAQGKASHEIVQWVLQGLCVAQERVAQGWLCNSRHCRGFAWDNSVAQVLHDGTFAECALHVGAWHKVRVAQEQLLQQLCVARRQSLHKRSCRTKPGRVRHTRGSRVARGQLLVACTTGGLCVAQELSLHKSVARGRVSPFLCVSFPKNSGPPGSPPPGSGRAAMGQRSR